MAFVTGQGMGEYCVDIVMCIDATGSMAPIINEVKDNALSFYQRFIDSMEENDKEVAELPLTLWKKTTKRLPNFALRLLFFAITFAIQSRWLSLSSLSYPSKILHLEISLAV